MARLANSSSFEVGCDHARVQGLGFVVQGLGFGV